MLTVSLCLYCAGFSILEIYVNGSGPVSDTVRKMVDGLNYTYISNNTISNEGKSMYRCAAENIRCS